MSSKIVRFSGIRKTRTNPLTKDRPSFRGFTMNCSEFQSSKDFCLLIHNGALLLTSDSLSHLGFLLL
jgi:hypothetical protein